MTRDFLPEPLKGEEMSDITIQLPDDRMEKLKRLAQDAHLPPEDLLRARVEQWLSEPPQDFVRAAQYVLKKNEELYRRLA